MMTKKLALLKPVVMLFVIACLTVNMFPLRVAEAASELPGETPVLFPFINEEDLKARIINSPEFIQKYALFAHYLGLGWCGGTASQYVGEDFDFYKEGNNYVLKARYNPNDPYADGYMADNRLKMTISNIRFYIDPSSIKTGTEKIINLDPEITQSFIAVNRGNTNDTASTSFTYTKSKTVGHSTNFSFEESLNIKKSLSVSVLFLTGSFEYSYGFTAGQAWSDSTSETDSSTMTTSYDTTVPAKSKKEIRLMSYKTQSEIPYTANIYMDYDITFSGFLRWGGNARTDHPTNRPQVNVTFGSGDLTAVEEIEKIYLNRAIPGYSSWDFAWMENEFGASNVNSLIGYITRRPMGANISGKFTCVDGTHVQIEAGEAIPLTAEELGGTAELKTKEAIDTATQNQSNMTFENIITNNSPEVRVNKTIVSTNNGSFELH